MPSIVIRLDAEKLQDPDLDLRYEIPELLAQRAPELLADDGYDYDDDNCMHIYLSTTDLERALPFVLRLLEEDRLHGNHLAAAATVGVSQLDAASTAGFRMVFPSESGEIIPRTR